MQAILCFLPDNGIGCVHQAGADLLAAMGGQAVHIQCITVGVTHEFLVDLVIRKGYNPAIDSYSAFFENDQTTPTGLEGYLRTRGITDLTMVGLALDFCVNFSAVDAARLGFKVTVQTDLCRAIDLNGSLDAAMAGMKAAGAQLK